MCGFFSEQVKLRYCFVLHATVRIWISTKMLIAVRMMHTVDVTQIVCDQFNIEIKMSYQKQKQIIHLEMVCRVQRKLFEWFFEFSGSIQNSGLLRFLFSIQFFLLPKREFYLILMKINSNQNTLNEIMHQTWSRK